MHQGCNKTQQNARLHLTFAIMVIRQQPDPGKATQQDARWQTSLGPREWSPLKGSPGIRNRVLLRCNGTAGTQAGCAFSWGRGALCRSMPLPIRAAPNLFQRVSHISPACMRGAHAGAEGVSLRTLPTRERERRWDEDVPSYKRNPITKTLPASRQPLIGSSA